MEDLEEDESDIEEAGEWGGSYWGAPGTGRGDEDEEDGEEDSDGEGEGACELFVVSCWCFFVMAFVMLILEKVPLFSASVLTHKGRQVYELCESHDYIL